MFEFLDTSKTYFRREQNMKIKQNLLYEKIYMLILELPVGK